MLKVDNWLRNVRAGVIPSVCLLCEAWAGDSGLCAGCSSDLPYHRAGCKSCGAGVVLDDRCSRCLDMPPIFDEIHCLLNYTPPADGLIQRLKFRGDLACARTLGILMAQFLCARDIVKPDIILPVPLHPRRLAARGYNQALELARPIARRLGVPLDAQSCRRVRATAEQANLSAEARQANVAGAFIADALSGKHVAVVDDVMTTGHTIEALTRALKDAGATRIAVWICARAG